MMAPTRELINQIFLEARKFAHGSVARLVFVACLSSGEGIVYQNASWELVSIMTELNDLITKP
jgi:superfamily II DNA/RNA helicase